LTRSSIKNLSTGGIYMVSLLFSLSWYRGHRAAGPALLTGVFGGLAVGWLIDNNGLGTQPWGIMLMPGVGFVAALAFIYFWYFRRPESTKGEERKGALGPLFASQLRRPAAVRRLGRRDRVPNCPSSVELNLRSFEYPPRKVWGSARLS